jgi:nucleolar protein 53
MDSGVLAERPSEELFVLDTEGSSTIQAFYNRDNKRLKVDEILEQRSAIPAIDSRKRAAPHVGDGVLPSKRHKKGGVSAKDYDRLRSIAYGGDQVKKDVVKVRDATYDPWAAEDAEHDPRLSFLDKKKSLREPETLKHAPVSLEASGRAFKSVRKPEAGKSYNPLAGDWADLLKREGDKEVEAEQKRRQAALMDAEREARIAAVAAEVSDDGQTDVDDSTWESEWEGIQSDLEEVEKLKQKRPQRKTQAERNRIKRRKENEAKERHERKQKQKEAQLAKVKEFIRLHEQKASQPKGDVIEHESGISSEGEEELRKTRFGRARIEDAPLELLLPEELTESLRLLKPEGNILKDRFRTLQIQGKIETRNRITQPKQSKRKATEKWTYKDWKLL